MQDNNSNKIVSYPLSIPQVCFEEALFGYKTTYTLLLFFP